MISPFFSVVHESGVRIGELAVGHFAKFMSKCPVKAFASRVRPQDKKRDAINAFSPCTIFHAVVVNDVVTQAFADLKGVNGWMLNVEVVE